MELPGKMNPRTWSYGVKRTPANELEDKMYTVKWSFGGKRIPENGVREA